MSRIKVLPDQVANQIAAGEVIERPASVIKELLENSLDADATRVEIEYKNGGRSYMRIEDNGCGMSKDETLLSLERHATSKISKADDLNELFTMGFRGEALPSIASVSRFQLQSRDADSDSGTEVLVNGGKLIHAKDCGMPQGTRIQVSNLFNSVPARRKFLKTDATESAHIVHCSRLYALANPEVAFSLIDDGRQIFKSPICSRLEDRISEIFGKQIIKNLLPLETSEGDMKLSGLIGRPGNSRSSRHEMLIYVNNRPVESRTLGYALVESFYGHIPKGRYPIAFLFLEMPPHLVDVNVHPAKREVRFRNEAQVRGFAIRSILETLRDYLDTLIVPSTFEKKPPAAASSEPITKPGLSKGGNDSHVEKPAKLEVEVAVSASKKPGANDSPPAQAIKAPVDAVESKSEDSHSPVLDRSWAFVGWAQEEFAIFNTDAGISLLNARAAEQRIWYERLKRQYEAQSVESQRLLIPLPVEFDPVSSAVLRDNLDYLETTGLGVAPFGRNFFRIEGIPTWLDESRAEDYLREVVTLLRDGEITDKKPLLGLEALAKHAAKQAVRGMEKADPEELQTMLDQLFSCENPLSDPDGHPSFIEISKGELERRFQRGSSHRKEELF